MERCLWKYRLSIRKSAKNGFFCPSIFRALMNTRIGDKIFQNIPRRVAKFRENRPGTSKNLWWEKETRLLAINVSIPNLTVARLEQFRLPQLPIQREPPSDVGVEWSRTILYTKASCRYCPSQATANVVSKLVAMATSLRLSISAMSSLDSLSPKTHP